MKYSLSEEHCIQEKLKIWQKNLKLPKENKSTLKKKKNLWEQSMFQHTLVSLKMRELIPYASVAYTKVNVTSKNA